MVFSKARLTDGVTDMPNALTQLNPMDAGTYFMQAREKKLATDSENELRRLAGEAYNAPTETRANALGALANQDVGLATQMQQHFGEMDEQERKRHEANGLQVAQSIRILMATPPALRAQAYQQLRQQVRDPQLMAALPEQYGPEIEQALPQLAQQIQGIEKAGTTDTAAIRTANYWRDVYANGTPEEKTIAARQLKLLSGPGQLGTMATGDGYYVTDPNRGTMAPMGMGQTGTASAPTPQPAAPAPQQPMAGITDEMLTQLQTMQPAERAAFLYTATTGKPSSAPPSGAVAGFSSGLTPPRTPAQVEAAAAAEKAAGDKAKVDKEFLSSFQAQIEQLDKDLDNASYAMNDALKLIDSGTATGVVGQLLSQFWGTNATNLQAKLDTLNSMAGLSKLQEMRAYAKEMGAASGASGLGQVTEKEMTLLQSAITSLASSQDDEQLKANIQRFVQQLEKTRQAVRQEYERAIRSQSQPEVGSGAPRVIRYDKQGNRIP